MDRSFGQFPPTTGMYLVSCLLKSDAAQMVQCLRQSFLRGRFMRLLVVDDAPDIATLLKLAFQLDGYAVDTALAGEQALEQASIHTYDVAILDLNLPDLDGMDVCRRLRAEQPQLLIIMLTARSSRREIIAGLDAGADDYLTKPFNYEELVARVRALLRRDMRVRQPLLQCGDLALDPAAGWAWQAGQRLSLSRKQFRILEYLMRRRGEVVSQEDLLEHVWNAEANPFTNTVRVHINALRRALNDTAAQQRYIETVVGQGYRFDDFAHPPDLTETLSPPMYASSTQPDESEARRNTMATRSWHDQLANAPKLLIVDDAPDITQLLVVYFHQAGFNTMAAYAGRAALDLARQTGPDLIILDLGLPDMDGLDVCREIRQTSSVPIVMLTKRNAEQDRQQGLAAGASAYVTKPFDAHNLQAVVRSLLSQPAQ
jgi:DNA-binding response OmpR family regulator